MQKTTVLIIEDEEILREISKDYLLNEGYRVLEAADGKEALTLFQEHEVDLIILDMHDWLTELKGKQTLIRPISPICLNKLRVYTTTKSFQIMKGGNVKVSEKDLQVIKAMIADASIPVTLRNKVQSIVADVFK